MKTPLMSNFALVPTESAAGGPFSLAQKAHPARESAMLKLS